MWFQLHLLLFSTVDMTVWIMKRKQNRKKSRASYKSPTKKLSRFWRWMLAIGEDKQGERKGRAVSNSFQVLVIRCTGTIINLVILTATIWGWYYYYLWTDKDIDKDFKELVWAYT